LSGHRLKVHIEWRYGFSQICWTGAADEFFHTARFPAAG
jgi:hypothetical protein